MSNTPGLTVARKPVPADIDRVVSFSLKPTDKRERAAVAKLKAHCDKTGTSFSFLMGQAALAKAKELGL